MRLCKERHFDAWLFSSDSQNLLDSAMAVHERAMFLAEGGYRATLAELLQFQNQIANLEQEAKDYGPLNVPRGHLQLIHHHLNRYTKYVVLLGKSLSNLTIFQQGGQLEKSERTIRDLGKLESRTRDYAAKFLVLTWQLALNEPYWEENPLLPDEYIERLRAINNLGQWSPN